MANDQQTQERNDPAIDPDTPDNAMGQAKAPEQPQSGQSQSSGAQSQDNQGAQSQANDGNRSGESADGNSYTPDFEPEEHESPDKTKEESQTGETDADIDTAGG